LQSSFALTLKGIYFASFDYHKYVQNIIDSHIFSLIIKLFLLPLGKGQTKKRLWKTHF